MASYVLVHGGGHGGWCWDWVAPLLRDAGHAVFTPTLKGVGERLREATPDLDLDTHIDQVADLLVSEHLNDVILGGHSYGGMVITGVADRVPERIARLVFIDAARPVDGEALVDTSPGTRTAVEPGIRTVDGVDLVLWPDVVPPVIYGLVRPEDRAFAEGKLTPHPWKTMIQPLRLRDPARVAAIPRAIVNCTGTLANRPQDTRKRWLDGDPLWEIDTGHDLMITEPAKLADMLLSLA